MHHLTATLTTGEVLTVAYDDQEQAVATLRTIDRWRQQPDLPEIFFKTVDGRRWCLCANDIAEGPTLVDPVAV